MQLSTPLTNVFRENVAHLLEEYAWTQTELAEQMGVTKAYVSQVMTGHRGIGLEGVDKFAKALQVSPGDLISKNLVNAG